VVPPRRILADDPDETYSHRDDHETVCAAAHTKKVARKYTNLEPFGRDGWYAGDCPRPDCTDNGQSFYISPTGSWECYRCRHSGDVVDLEFLCGNYGSPQEAMMALAIEYGIELSQESNGYHSNRLIFKTAKEVAETTPQEVPWTVPPWTAKGAITEIDGPIKRAGKTTLVSHMVASALDGKLFLGESTTRAKVVWLTEQSPTSFRKVLERAGLTDREDLLILPWHDTIGTEWPKVAKIAADKAMEFGAEMLVVDTLGQFAGIRGDSENSAGAAQEAMQPLQEAAARGLSVVITRHERKGGGEVGESASLNYS